MKTRFIIFITLLVTLSISQKANAEESESVIAIENVSYQYELFKDKYGELDCTGTLKISARIPTTPDVKAIILERSTYHYIPEGDRMFLGLKRVIETEPGQTHVDIVVENVSWGVYFRLWANYDNNHSIGTDIFTTNSYISEQDLDAILNQSGIENIEEEPVSITVNDKTLTIETSGSMPLRIFDLQGTTLYSGIAEGEVSIPVNAPFVIVQYKNNNKTITKKIILK